MTYNSVKDMTPTLWTVEHVGQAKKALKEILKYLSEDARDEYAFLLGELKSLGPIRRNWPNFRALGGRDDDYHCHLKKGRPTYVACWRVDKKKKYIEVYYVGTHEKAPY